MIEERPQENYTTRIKAATEKVEIPSVIEESETILNPTEDPMSALDLLVETQDSEGSICWIDRFGVFYSTNRYWLDKMSPGQFGASNFYNSERFTFTNNPREEQEIGINGPVEEVCLSLTSSPQHTGSSTASLLQLPEEEDEGFDEDGNPIVKKSL